jgi:hypothetical protein
MPLLAVKIHLKSVYTAESLVKLEVIFLMTIYMI